MRNDFKFDERALRSELKARNLSLQTASQELSRGRSYLNQAIYHGCKLPSSVVKLMTVMWDIKPGDIIAHDNSADDAEPQKELNPSIDYDLLSKCIEDAVYRALNR